MAHTTSTSIEIPLSIAAQYHLTAVTLAPLRLLLVAESERAPGEHVVDIPIQRARALAGMTAKTLQESIARLARLRTRVVAASDDRSAEVEAMRIFSPFDEPPRAYHDDLDERVRVRFSREWVTGARGAKVEIPLDELHRFGTRAGLLLRLRAGAMVHAAPSARLKVLVRDLPLLSGSDNLKAVEHWIKHLVPGFADFERVVTSVRIDALDAARTPTRHLQSVVIKARRMDARSARAVASSRWVPDREAWIE